MLPEQIVQLFERQTSSHNKRAEFARLGISQSTFYSWQKKYSEGGVEAFGAMRRLWTKDEEVCAYCGINKEQQQLVFERMGRSVRDVELQIDRKDSSQGYSIENICFACRVCYEHKKDFFSYEQFQRIAKRFLQPKMAFLLGGKTSAKAL